MDTEQFVHAHLDRVCPVARRLESRIVSYDRLLFAAFNRVTRRYEVWRWCLDGPQPILIVESEQGGYLHPDQLGDHVLRLLRGMDRAHAVGSTKDLVRELQARTERALSRQQNRAFEEAAEVGKFLHTSDTDPVVTLRGVRKAYGNALPEELAGLEDV